MITQEHLGYRAVGRRSDFPAGLGRTVRLGNLELAVFHTTDGELFALENRTPHPKGGTLSEAIVSGHFIYCPLRDLKINLEDGRVQAPDTGFAQAYPVRITEGIVEIDVIRLTDED
ncbi:nitrite reductase (NAD(P)H) small subunit [Paenibacillus soyae]|uniref:Nitrite reductase (NAD(P)H) small subunit n=1 Tax=Paenibacillus soyae TaxID=2969249 RepID=A0A9X2MQK8_9BACL|nr:nitrite reductase (NAD(P)H) small subunit [Paenibacillus soyae]MCR2804048.1 nitrite reductase (NAD(P)H) small subunit [Paenibacillus soyae]